MSDLDLLLRAILLGPADDFPRLQMADVLEEAGDLARAEFIRSMIELSSLLPPEIVHKCVFERPQLPAHREEILRSTASLPTEQLEAAAQARCRVAHACRNDVRLHEELAYWRKRADGRFNRGLLESVSLPLAAFMEHAETLFRSHPIVSVHLTDIEPLDVDRRLTDDVDQPVHGYYRWHDDQIGGPEYSFNDLPPELWDRLERHLPIEQHQNKGLWKDYSERNEALAALSPACVALGRRKAGLPPLPALAAV